ncbi:hypothetical protein CesoFtcFv8_000578 [Champsocephalus esox]|uniref:Uncharacterized protein n=1 Tax=Champsocephalus esox TaxID=159716 RepID=A0AAN8D461_9TELE|nr:hypothetical protein CesoFtcFv8_000578 [Champsocephalus esox]
MQYYQHLLQPISQQQQPPPPQQQTPPQVLPPQQRAPSKWLGGSSNQQPPPPQQGPPGGLSPLGPIGQWGSPALPDLSSDLYSLGLVSTYMDSVMSEMLGQKPQGPRNNTWPNRDQSEGVFGVLGDTLPFDPAVGSDPEFARYVAGVSQAMQQKRQVQHIRRPSNTRSNWPMAEEQHRTWSHPEYYSEGEAVNSSWSANQGDSASSSDETSSANGDSLFSMFSGPDLVAAVKQRRKHSCGEPEDSKTKTWPPQSSMATLHPHQHHAQPQLLPVPDEPPPPLLPVERLHADAPVSGVVYRRRLPPPPLASPLASPSPSSSSSNNNNNNSSNNTTNP